MEKVGQFRKKSTNTEQKSANTEKKNWTNTVQFFFIGRVCHSNDAG